jgi:hypothetical protein
MDNVSSLRRELAGCPLQTGPSLNRMRKPFKAHPFRLRFLRKFAIFWSTVTDKSEQIACQLFNVLEIAW